MPRKKTQVEADPAEAMKRSAALLWGPAERPTRGPKPGLSLDGIVEAAIRVADADGLAAVSMQRVASEFGFTTMSLYRYVPGKSELIDLMVDAAIGPPPSLDEIDGGWRPKLREWARATRDAFGRHPWFLGAAIGRMMGPNQVGWLESAVAALEPSGLVGTELVEAALVINGHVRASAPYQPASPAGRAAGPSDPAGPGDPAASGASNGAAGATDGVLSADDWAQASASLLREQASRFPALARAMAAGAFGADEPDGFEFGLERILDGIEAYVRRRASA